jgi:hypothetical protein
MSRQPVDRRFDIPPTILCPSSRLGKKAGVLMSSQPVLAAAGRTLRHWTIDSQASAGVFQRPAPAPPYSEHPDGAPCDRLAAKLVRVKSDLALRNSQRESHRVKNSPSGAGAAAA